MKWDSQHLLTYKHINRVVVGLIIFFSFLILIEYSSLLSPMIPRSLTQKQGQGLGKKGVSNDPLSTLLQASLFGEYLPSVLDANQIKQSGLDLVVVGILFSSELKDSLVIIRSAEGEEGTYKIGDQLPGGAVIKQIMAEGILVEREGNLERLSLPKNELHFEPPSKPLQEDK